MNERLRLLSRATRAALASGVVLCAGLCAAQSPGDLGPSSSGATRAPIGVPMQRTSPHSPTANAVRTTKEAQDLRNCARANGAAYSLIRAAEDVVTTQNNIRNAGATAASYQNELLQKQFQTYKSMGGTAASAKDVQPPEDPCKTQKEALHQRSLAIEKQYEQCSADRPDDMKAAALSKELVAGRNYLAMIERIRKEQGTAATPPAPAPASERTAKLKTDPEEIRAELAAKFDAYRKAGGRATRVEDVTELPNPCLPAPRNRARDAPERAPQAAVPSTN